MDRFDNLRGVRFVGLGAGGHTRMVLDILELRGAVVEGLVERPGTSWEAAGVTIIGSDDDLPALASSGIVAAFVGVGGVRAGSGRSRLFGLCRAAGFALPALAHPSAIVARTATIGDGAQLMPGAIVNPGAELGENVIVNSGAIVEHDCVVGPHVHVAPRACLCAQVEVGEGSHIGAGAVVRQGVRIGARVTVGAGAVVVRDVEDGVTVVGVPARVA